MITKEQVEKISKLVKLDLTDTEKERFSEMFSDTPNYIDILKELDTQKVKETYQVNGLTNVFQSSENTKTLTQEEVLSNASKKKKDLFVTDGVFDRE